MSIHKKWCTVCSNNIIGAPIGLIMLFKQWWCQHHFVFFGGQMRGKTFFRGARPSRSSSFWSLQGAKTLKKSSLLTTLYMKMSIFHDFTESWSIFSSFHRKLGANRGGKKNFRGHFAPPLHPLDRHCIQNVMYENESKWRRVYMTYEMTSFSGIVLICNSFCFLNEHFWPSCAQISFWILL